MKRSKLLTLYVAGIAFAVVAGTVVAQRLNQNTQSLRPPSSEQPLLTVDPAYLDFGEVWETDKFEWTIPITNTSDKHIQIKSITGDCSCTTIGRWPPTLAPGTTADIPLTLDLFRFGTGKRDLWVTTSVTSINVQMKLGDVRTTQVIKLHGAIKSQLRCSTTEIDVGRRSIRQKPTLFPVKVTLHQDVEFFQVAGTSGLTITSCETKAVKTYVVTIKLHSSLPLGSIAEQITFDCVDKDGKRLPSRKVSIVGTTVPDVSVTPYTLHFGDVFVGETVGEEILVRSVSDSPFEVLRVGFSNSETRVMAASGSSKSEKKYSVLLTPQRGGANESILTFDVRDIAGETYAIVYPVSYIGKPPTIGRGKDK